MESNSLQLLQVFLIIIVGLLVFWSFLREKKSSKNLKSMQNDFNKLNHQKKSSEVRIAEQLAPFLEKFPYDPKKISFLGNPIDYVYFGDDKVTIIEIKSGNARLSKKQRAIKKLIMEGKVEWDEIRIK